MADQQESDDMRNAALRGDTRAVEALLDGGADTDQRTSDGWTPLMYAALGGSVQTVELLLGQGAQVNGQRADGWTALMIACLWGHTAVVKCLLGHRADVNVKAGDSWTAIKIAAERGEGEILGLLQKASSQPKEIIAISASPGGSALTVDTKEAEKNETNTEQ